MDVASQKRSKGKNGGSMMNEQEKIRVVIADRDMFYLQKLKLCLERKGDMTVVGMADNGAAAFRMILETKPEVVLLDAILGEKDGVWVLENMKQQQIQCVCIMISAIDSDALVRRAIAMGADYYMAKPIQGELLLERIRQLTEVRTVYMEPSPGNFIQPLQNNQHQMSALEVDISAILSRMGIPASIKGYHFIRRAVFMAVENREVMVGITKGLYPDIARMYHTTASKVERAIRHAVEHAWKKNGRQVYFEISGYFMTEKPTNGQFIAILAEYFRMGGRCKFSSGGYQDPVHTETQAEVGEKKVILFS